MNLNYLKKIGFNALIVLLMLSISPMVKGQILTKLSKTFNDGADMVKSIGRLADATKMTAA